MDVPTYSVIDLTETTLTVNTYRTDTDEPIDSQFMIVKSADHSQLTDLISQAEALSADDYTEDSYSVMQQALEAATAVNNDAQATTEELTNAYTALKSAIDALVEKPVQTPTDDEQNGTTTDPSQNGTTTDPSQNGTTENPSQNGSAREIKTHLRQE